MLPEEQLQWLVDIEQIKQLKARYAAACDDGYAADDIAALFTESAVWDGGMMGFAETREGIREFFRNASSVVGFAVHAWLPRRFRLPFFLVLFIVSAFVILGWSYTAILLGLGLMLLGICHLPIPWMARVIVLIVVGGTLAALRSELFMANWTGVVLPILAAMFMFRLAVYVYDLKNEKGPISPWHRLAYFFMPPNIVFPFYPVVDFKMFLRTYYDEDEYEIYQKGVQLMLLGIVHLFIYRLVYHHLVPSVAEVENFTDVALFAASSFLLYVRISGMFHLIAGVLCLFGFNLPPTNSWFFFAPSLTEIWRRINIYWMEFLKKLVYFPIVMRLRTRGMKLAMLVATSCVFLFSWLFHSYQWFWIQGGFPIASVDMIFWGSVGLLVVVNTSVEINRTRRSTTNGSERALRKAIITSLKTAGVFCLISFLWSIWASASLPGWLALISQARVDFGIGLARSLGVLVGASAIYAVFLYGRTKGWFPVLKLAFASKVAATGAAVIVLCISGLASDIVKRGENPSEVWFTLTENRLNVQDQERQIVGYYEGLLDRDEAGKRTRRGTVRMMAGGWEQEMKKPKDWLHLSEAGLTRETDDLRMYELIPSLSVQLRRAKLTTNRWGMRDKEYDKEKPPGVIRIAVLGASPEMGPGVHDHETFESILEERLNREPKPAGVSGYEILNFAVFGYGIIQHVAQCENLVFDFEPDILLYCSHHGKGQHALFRYFMKHVSNDSRLPPVLKEYKREISGMTRKDYKRRRNQLEPYYKKVLEWAYGRIVAMSVCRGTIPIWIHVPSPNRKEIYKVDTVSVNMAKQTGFQVISLEGAYDGWDGSTLWVASWDKHPNSMGHMLLAQELYKKLKENPELLSHLSSMNN